MTLNMMDMMTYRDISYNKMTHLMDQDLWFVPNIKTSLSVLKLQIMQTQHSPVQSAPHYRTRSNVIQYTSADTLNLAGNPLTIDREPDIIHGDGIHSLNKVCLCRQINSHLMINCIE